MSGDVALTAHVTFSGIEKFLRLRQRVHRCRVDGRSASQLLTSDQAHGKTSRTLAITNAGIKGTAGIGGLTPLSEERFSERLRLASELELDELGRIDLVVLNDAPPLLGQRPLECQRILPASGVHACRWRRYGVTPRPFCSQKDAPN